MVGCASNGVPGVPPESSCHRGEGAKTEMGDKDDEKKTPVC